MAKRQNEPNVPETVITEQGGTPPFPEAPDNKAFWYPAPGLVKCVCVTKCVRGGLVRPGEVRYFREVPEHFKAVEQTTVGDKPAE